MSNKRLTNDRLVETRNKTCKAARALYQEGGEAAVTMRSLSKAMGCSPMLPYSYFPKGRDEILAAIKTEALNKFAEWIEENHLETESDTIKFIENYAESYITFALNDSLSFRIMVELSQIKGESYKELEQATARVAEPFLNAIRRAIDAGSLKGEPLVIAQILWASAHGLASLHLSNQLEFGYSLEDLMPLMSKVLRTGIRSLS